MRSNVSEPLLLPVLLSSTTGMQGQGEKDEKLSVYHILKHSNRQ